MNISSAKISLINRMIQAIKTTISKASPRTLMKAKPMQGITKPKLDLTKEAKVIIEFVYDFNRWSTKVHSGRLRDLKAVKSINLHNILTNNGTMLLYFG